MDATKRKLTAEIPIRRRQK